MSFFRQLKAVFYRYYPGTGPGAGGSTGCCHGYRTDESLSHVSLLTGQYVDYRYICRYGGAMEGGEYNAALWTLALLLFVISFILIFIIHHVGKSALRG